MCAGDEGIILFCISELREFYEREHDNDNKMILIFRQGHFNLQLNECSHARKQN